MANRPQIAVLISGSGSNLQAIIDGCQSGQIEAEICVVVSNNEEAFGLQRAEKAGIPTQILDHRNYENREAYDSELVHCLNQYQPDLLVLAGFMRILTPLFTEAFVGKLINIHPSLLPKYPGLHTHRRALDAGDSHHGATVHFVTAELDGGPPILQASIQILDGDTEKSIASRVLSEVEHKIYPLAVKWFVEKRVQMIDGKAWLDGELVGSSGFQYGKEEKT